jgi:hypothetical protein
MFIKPRDVDAAPLFVPHFIPSALGRVGNPRSGTVERPAC